MTNQIICEELSRIGREYSLDFGHLPPAAPAKDPEYYPQFDAAIRSEAAAMSKHYEVFYSLEKSIRVLVSETIESADGREDWWDSPRVPEAIRNDVRSRIQKEIDAEVSRRSAGRVGLHHLRRVIEHHYSQLGHLRRHPLQQQEGIRKVMASLNALRNPIAHCSPLAEDEQLRLRLAVRDWFRLME